MIEVVIGELERHELPLAAGVVGRAYRDNPLSLAILGHDPAVRLRGVERLLRARLIGMERAPLVARRAGWIAGVCGMAPPGMCQPSPRTVLRMLPALLQVGPRAVWKMFGMRAEWEKREPKERHWHLGPVGVEPALQGMAVGGRMMERFCAQMDHEGGMAWLDTDRVENVRFYERFGFVVEDTAEVIGVPNWFMRREPSAR